MRGTHLSYFQKKTRGQNIRIQKISASQFNKSITFENIRIINKKWFWCIFLHFIKSVLFIIFSNTSLKYKRECQKLRDRWGADPIHLTPAGYSALAESLLDSYSTEKEEKKDSADPVKDTANRRDGLSRSSWTANRWDSGTAHGSQSRYLGPWGRQAKGSGRPDKRLKL